MKRDEDIKIKRGIMNEINHKKLCISINTHKNERRTKYTIIQNKQLTRIHIVFHLHIPYINDQSLTLRV